MFKYLFTILIAIFSFQYIFPSNIIDTLPIREVDHKDQDGLMKHWKVYEGYVINDNRIQYPDLIQETWISDNEDILLKVIVPGSPPPDEYDKTTVQLSRNFNVAILDGVPATSWIFGCGPTSGQMIAGYYDRHGYDEIYTGPTNDGFFPLDNSIWGSTVINGELRELGPLSASMMGLDGRTEKGHVDDYWYQDGSEIDPYYGNWLEHDWYAEHSCLADFMGTSQQNNYGLSDGSTFIWVWTSGHQMIKEEFGDIAYGVNEFFENKGYNVDTYYSQITMGGSWWEEGALGFTFENYKNEIDNARPVMIHVEGHIMVGVGYDDSTSPETIYIHNTWDYNLHSMDWNGSYSGMPMWAVSCFQLSSSDFASADFSASSTSGDAPLSVEFTDNSISWDGEIIYWSWNFGDGNTSTDQNPTHIFNVPGEYTITLSVTDNNGNIVTKTKENYINVSQPPDMCAPNNFDINNMNNSISLFWDTRPGEYEELRYFTSWWQSSYLWYATLSEGAGHGVLFTPAGTYDIDSVHVGVQWTFPTEEHEGPVAVQIYTESNDMPDELIWSGETSTIIQDLSNDFGTPGTYGWALIYPAISNLSGDIFVFVGQGENWEGEAFLYDWDSDFNGGVADNPDNIYVVENGIFSQGLGSYLNGDPMTATYIRNYGSEESCDYDGFLYHNIYRNGELINTTTLEEYTDILLEEGEHCYQVSNVYESGESELTAQECIDYQNTPPLEFNLLDPVDNSEVTTLTPLLSWEAAIDTDPFDILKYTLYFDTPEPGIMDIFVDTATSYEVPTLLDNTAYYWKVVATDLFGEAIENIGGYHSFIINTANDSPANFELVTPTDGSVEITLTPFFYWEPATDLDPNDMVSYNLYIDLDNLFTDTAPILLDTNAFDYSTLNIFLNDNSSYLWTVNASDNHAAITNTDTLQFWTDQYSEPPEPFGRISPSNDTELDLGNVIFTWGSTIDVDPLDFVQYTLMYTYNGGDTTIIPELLDTTYAVELDIDRQYYWHVIASDKDALLTFADGSEGMWSFVLGSLNINELLSLTEYALYNAYPNPFNPVTAIKYAVPEASHLSISIYDMIGREIAELYNGSQVPGFHTVIWDASEISSGIYFAKMIAGEYISTQKLMLIK